MSVYYSVYTVYNNMYAYSGVCLLTWRRLSPVGQLALCGMGQGVTGHCKKTTIINIRALTYTRNTDSTTVQD